VWGDAGVGQLMSNRCERCRFWTQVVTYRGAFGDCGSGKFRLGYNLVGVPSDCAIVEDDEGWGIVTGSHFGCVHWEIGVEITPLAKFREDKHGKDRG